MKDTRPKLDGSPAPIAEAPLEEAGYEIKAAANLGRTMLETSANDGHPGDQSEFSGPGKLQEGAITDVPGAEKYPTVRMSENDLLALGKLNIQDPFQAREITEILARNNMSLGAVYKVERDDGSIVFVTTNADDLGTFIDIDNA